MPRAQVTATVSKAIPGSASRKLIVFRNLTGGATCYWGFEPTITSDTGAPTCGVSLLAGEAVVLAGDNANLHKPIYFVTSAGDTTLLYTEN